MSIQNDRTVLGADFTAENRVPLVVYPLAADNVSGPLLTRLRGVNQLVIRT